jgi:hypothetical protein
MYCPVLYHYAISLKTYLRKESATLNTEFLEELDQGANTWQLGPPAPAALTRYRLFLCCAIVKPLLRNLEHVSLRLGDSAIGFTMEGVLAEAQDDLENRTFCVNCVHQWLLKAAEELQVDCAEYNMTTSGVGAEQLRELRLRQRSSFINAAVDVFVRTRDFVEGREHNASAGEIAKATLGMLTSFKLASGQLMHFFRQLEGIKINGAA